MKRKIISMILIAMIALTGCHAEIKSGYGGSYANSMAANSMTMESAAYDYDYSSGQITGDYADYSYTFRAEGETTKTRHDMLDYFEEVQELVDANGGFIQSLDNTYDDYTDGSGRNSWMARDYKTYGTVRFNVQIPEEEVQLVLDSLEKFCKDNSFTVTTFSQYIYNYKGHTVVDDGTEIDWHDRDYLVTEGELKNRLAYSEISVSLSYYQEQGRMAKFRYGISDIWDEFWYSVGDVVSAFLAAAVGLVILFAEFILFVRIYRKADRKHRLKHPEYYPPKEVTLVGSRIKENDKTEAQ